MVYQVDSVIYDITQSGTEQIFSTAFIKEEIVETFTDNTGRQVYRIERYYRQDETNPWEIKDVWTAGVRNNQAERTEENLRFIKMVFPLREGTIWNGNLFIDETTIIPIAGESLEVYKNWEYEVIGVGVPDEIRGIVYDEVATMTQANNENLIEYRYSLEKYAKNIGLIYKEMKILDTQCIDACEGQPWEDKAEKGFILRQFLISHN